MPKKKKFHISLPADAYDKVLAYMQANDCLRSTTITLAVDRYSRLPVQGKPVITSYTGHVRFILALPLELQRQVEQWSRDWQAPVNLVIAQAIREML